MDSNYGEVILLGREATQGLEFSVFPKAVVTPVDANWGKWLGEMIGVRRAAA